MTCSRSGWAGLSGRLPALRAAAGPGGWGGDGPSVPCVNEGGAAPAPGPQRLRLARPERASLAPRGRGLRAYAARGARGGDAPDPGNGGGAGGDRVRGKGPVCRAGGEAAWWPSV